MEQVKIKLFDAKTGEEIKGQKKALRLGQIINRSTVRGLIKKGKTVEEIAEFLGISKELASRFAKEVMDKQFEKEMED